MESDSAMKLPTLPLVIAFVFLAGCNRGLPPELAAVAPTTVVVAAAPFETLWHFPQREAPATALGRNETRLAAEVAARVVAIAVDSGDHFKTGQVLLRLDPKDAELALARAAAALDQAAARLAQAEAQTARARSLREKSFISVEALTLRETELAAARADVAAAQANRDSARRGVDKCSIVAPFTGIVRSRAAQLGELAAPGTPLLTLADTGDMQVVAQVQARDAEGLAAAVRVEFETAGGSHALTPLRISAAVNREARTVEARHRFNAAPPAPGSEGRLLWRDPRPHLAAEYILRRNGRYGVFLLDGDTARFHELPQAQEGRPASADFAPDARVVTRGRNALQDGMKVTIESAPAQQ